MSVSVESTGQPAALGLPRVVGPYVLYDQIGRGGMADIFVARTADPLGIERRVVLKMLLPELSSDPRFAQQIIEEAKLGALLSHGNVVQVIDLGRDGDRLYIAMEYVEGFDLRQFLVALSKARIALPMEFALFIAREVLRALDVAHRANDAAGRPLGIVHRDVSPSNVLISFAGEVKLCDFGIARATAAGAEAEVVRAAKVIGKSAYMSPEQARGDTVDARSDVFSAAILLWELCAGRRLYRGSEQEMLASARLGEVPPLPTMDLPEAWALQAILDRALTVDPDQRFASARELLDALDGFVLGAGLGASQLRFGTFLTDHFAAEVVAHRRAHSGETPVPVRASGPEVAFVTPSEPAAPIKSEVRAILGRGGVMGRRRNLLEIADASTRLSIPRVYVIGAVCVAAGALAAWLLLG